MQTIQFSDFQKVEIRIGTIVSAEIFKEAKKPAYKLQVDLGKLGIKKSSAQITEYYKAEDLPGKQVICICNFPPKQIANIMSEVLVTGFHDENGHVSLATTDLKVPDGTKLS
ncbi:tRNA-binding protein [Echinicola strongylocentroti]|uniref:tRNA-binding protein n=1 Tax=Echinicola strongylocentroti TaxID=1795355 RepID=A0A2Z4IHX7_9BACT|nr:tRNA-binding protein [Echinicola strongylocentroti]AWW30525.1 tRNA-binding protein [Echinicola strongylocentroti]